MSKLLGNHISVSALTGTKVPCRLLTKTRIFDAHKNGQKRVRRGRNDAPEVLNDGVINGDAAELREKKHKKILEVWK